MNCEYWSSGPCVLTCSKHDAGITGVGTACDGCYDDGTMWQDVLLVVVDNGDLGRLLVCGDGKALERDTVTSISYHTLILRLEMSCETHTRQAEKSHLVEISHLEPYHVAEIYLTLNPFLLLRYTSPWILILLFRYILLEPSLVEMYLTLNPILLRCISPQTLSCCWDISYLEPYPVVEIYLTLNPTLLRCISP